jgi:hypothetical protein
MFKKCKPLWREADFEVKSAKNIKKLTFAKHTTFGALLDVQPRHTTQHYKFATIQLQLQLQLQPHYTTHTPLHHTLAHFATTTTTTTTATTTTTTTATTATATTTTLQLQLHQLQLQLYNATATAAAATNNTLHYLYATLHPAVVVEVTTAAVTTPKSTTPTTFRSINGFALPSMHHNNSPPL